MSAETIRLDPDDLTIGDLEDFEEIMAEVAGGVRRRFAVKGVPDAGAVRNFQGGHTRRAAAVDQNVVSWTVDGEEIAVDLHGITGHEWRAAREATGMRHLEIIQAALALKDFEAIAALVWIAKRRQSPKLTYERVLGSLSVASMAAVEDG